MTARVEDTYRRWAVRVAATFGAIAAAAGALAAIRFADGNVGMAMTRQAP
jgi:hypothetical protein